MPSRPTPRWLLVEALATPLLVELARRVSPRWHRRLQASERRRKRRPAWKGVLRAVAIAVAGEALIGRMRASIAHLGFYLVPPDRVRHLPSLPGDLERPPARDESVFEHLACVLDYLDETGVLGETAEHAEMSTELQEERGDTYHLFESSPALIARLDPVHFDGADLRRYFEEEYEMDASDAGAAMLEAIRVLRENLAAAGSERLLLVVTP